jgi:hypothetical protein
LNQAKRRSNLSSLEASPLMLKMVCSTQCKQAEAPPLTVTRRSHLSCRHSDYVGSAGHAANCISRKPCMHGTALGCLGVYTRPLSSTCMSCCCAANASTRPHLVDCHLPLTQPVHQLIAHLQDTPSSQHACHVGANMSS